ncbi:MAG: hypothetical protein LBI19_02045 [Oscillospiraceae bacterium]|jgi:hypothetical protein|nr:hypothetical protein [Oscillospiraceae bacterium]
MARKQKIPFEDDGRVVADMSGIDEYRPRFILPRKRKDLASSSRGGEADESGPGQDGVEPDGCGVIPPKEPLTKEQARMVTFASLRAGLLIALLFIAGAALFILFCIHVWFR